MATPSPEKVPWESRLAIYDHTGNVMQNSETYYKDSLIWKAIKVDISPATCSTSAEP